MSPILAVDLFPRTRQKSDINLGLSSHVETVVLLSKLKSTHHIEVEISIDEMDLTKSESKITYDEIKQYVFDKYGLKVSQLYIAQVKRKHGLIERKRQPMEGDAGIKTAGASTTASAME